MNVPKLRFKEFTDVWKEYPLKYFTTPIKRKNINNESDLPLTISSLDGLVDQRTYFNKVVASKDMSNYYLLKKGEFAYNKSYSVGFPFGSIKRLDKYNQGALSSLYICFQVNNMNSDFIVKYFESPQWHKQISLCVAEGARNHGLLNVNINDFFSTKHFLPQLAEQEKIANFLAIVDKKIINLENTITNLENQKKGLLQQIFSQKLRFKDKNGNNYPNWEKKKLGDIGSFSRGGNLSKSDLSKKGTSCILYGELYTYYNEFATEIKSKTLNTTNLVLSKKYDVLLPLSGETAEDISTCTCIFFDDIALGSDLLIFRSSFFDGRFMSLLLKYKYKYKIAQIAQGKSIVHISEKNIKNINIKIPCIEEQQNIADFILIFTKKLENQKAQLEHWKQIKKGLLQQMFV